MLDQLKLHKTTLLLLLTGCVFYWVFAYDLDRTKFTTLLSLYGALFFLSWKIFQLEKQNFRLLLGVAIVFRVVFLFAIPNLSQDFYRFIWDGKLLLQGINPYLFTPDELMPNPPIRGAQPLFNGMGELSAGNPTTYPPLNQLLFALAAFLGGKSIFGAVVSLRLIIIAADVGIYYFGRKLLKKLNLSENRIFWYLLNPFIVIELTGNLHFEGVMVFFLLAAVYFLYLKKWFFSALLFSCSIAVKLIPLIFLPLLFRKFGWKKALGYYAATGILLLLFFFPFLWGAFAENFFTSINLWFQKFEFNASFYYVIRRIGYEVEGYNIIGYAGPALAGVVFILVLALSTLKRNIRMRGLLTSMMFALVIYLLLATTVHPWYLATPLLLSIFTRYIFVQVWSLMVVLSYFAYSHQNYQENLWIIGLEYVVVFVVLGYELLKKQKTSLNPEIQGQNS